MSKDNPVNTKLPSYEVHSATMERLLREWARDLKKTLPPGIGFTLFLFDFGEDNLPGNLFYISSAQRDGMIETIKEFLKKQEQQKT
jgi:hypothetical protein